MKFVVLAALLSGSLAAQAATETKDFDAKNIHEVEVENTSGWIKISGTASERATVTAEKVEFDEKKCRLEIKQDGTELNVSVEKTGWGKAECRVNLTLVVPTAVSVDVESGAGGLDISGTKGEIDFRLGSGDVTIDAQVTELEGRTGSGKVMAKGLSGNADLRTGSGDMNLAYSAVPVKGSLHLKTGSGDALVMMPATAQVQADLRAGSGKVTNELGENKNAGFKVSMSAGAGDLTLRKTQ